MYVCRNAQTLEAPVGLFFVVAIERCYGSCKHFVHPLEKVSIVFCTPITVELNYCPVAY